MEIFNCINMISGHEDFMYAFCFLSIDKFKKKQKTYIQIVKYNYNITVCIYPTPLPWTGCDTMSVFQ